MCAKFQDNDVEIDEDNRSSAASTPVPYLCMVYLLSVCASWAMQ